MPLCSELALRRALWAQGLRYRINFSALPGKPDIVFLKKKVAVFIDGEFWHGYNWEEKKKKIKANRDYWIKKIERNMERDKANSQKLIDNGFIVLRFLEREIKKDIEACMERIIAHLGVG